MMDPSRTKEELSEENSALKRRIKELEHSETERKRAEEALRKSEANYRQLFDNSPTAIYQIDFRSGKFLKANDVICEYLGCSQEEITSLSPYDIMTAESRQLLLERLKKMGLGEKVTENPEYEITDKSGKSRWLQLNSKNIYDADGSVIGADVVAHEITDRKRAEEENLRLAERLQRAEKMEALGTLAGGVAHDLNNVLGIVVGYSELALHEVDESSPIRTHLLNIMSGGEKAAAIVQDMLTMTRRGVSNRQTLNLNKLILDDQLSLEFKTLCAYHPSVRLKIDLEPNALNISGSPVHIGKTLLNLVSNGCEAMPKGGVLTIRTANRYIDRPIQGYDEVREGDYVMLSVSDTGEGIPEADLKRIFEPFYTKKAMGRSGTGLGMAVVWGTVQDHYGYINVQNEDGKGSTFTLYFPVTREALAADRAVMTVAEYFGRGESILIVDDVEGQRDLAAAMLGKLNYSVASVASGEEAVEYLKTKEADLIVLDMIMDPGIDGFETYRRISQIRPGQKAIIVSGFAETERVRMVQALGAGAFVRKPYIAERLGLAVRKEIERP